MRPLLFCGLRKAGQAGCLRSRVFALDAAGGGRAVVGMSQERALKAESEEMMGSLMEIMGIKPEDIVAELDRRAQREFEKAVREQRLAAKNFGETRVMKCADGTGAYLDFRVHRYFYHYWGQRLGYECWSDAQFVRQFLMKNPECRVKLVRDTQIVAGISLAKPGIGSGELKVESGVPAPALSPGAAVSPPAVSTAAV